MKYLILFVALSFSAFAQNEQWNLPVAQQDTTITYTVAANKTQIWVIEGDTIATLDCYQVAARRRINPSPKYWLSMTEINTERDKKREEIQSLSGEYCILHKLGTAGKDVTNADVGVFHDNLWKQWRQYTKVVKKGAIPVE